jgi:hypothetical protein
MSDKIKLVQGDNRPYIKLTLRDADGAPMNLASATVKVYFRAVGTTTILSTLNCTLIGDGSTGQVQFNFPGSALDVPPGSYEGEVEVNFSGEIQTVYDTLRFQVRQQFD